MEESSRLKIVVRVTQRHHVQRCKTEDMGGRYISYLHCGLRVNTCNAKFLQMSRLNTPVKNSSLDTHLHVYGCLERE